MLRARGIQRGRAKGESGKYGVPLHRIQVVIRAVHGSSGSAFSPAVQRRRRRRSGIRETRSPNSQPPLILRIDESSDAWLFPFSLVADSKRKVPVRLRMEIPPRNDEPRPEGALGIARRHR